jgi:hypothetical protein
VSHCFGVATPRARRRHRCDICPDPIEPGTIYETWSGVDDGSWWRVRVHPACWAIARQYAMEGGWVDFHDYLLINIGADDAPTLDDLIAIAGPDEGERVWRHMYNMPGGPGKTEDE